jgi:hypothetical protein
MFVKEETRQLARMVTIDKIIPIARADRLEKAVVGGWECVVQKGLYQPGDTALYFEIDSAIPLNHPVLANFDKKYLKVSKDEATGEDYAVIKTVRLRSERSQGLLLSAKDYAHVIGNQPTGKDLTGALGVLKYVSAEEAKLYAVEDDNNNRNQTPFRQFVHNLRMKLLGNIVVDGLLPFPLGHKKSDQQRVQNCSQNYRAIRESGDTVEETVKLNGESALFYLDLNTGEAGVAQRNFGLRTLDVYYTKTEALRVYASDLIRYVVRKCAGARVQFPKWKNRYYAQSVPLVNYFYRNNIAKKLRDAEYIQGMRVAIQGEMVGPDFNGNKENAPVNRFYMYQAYVNGSTPLSPTRARAIAKAIGVEYVPVIETDLKLPETIAEVLKRAEGPGVFDASIQREGVVHKCNTTGESFKIISNKWLEQEDK